MILAAVLLACGGLQEPGRFPDTSRPRPASTSPVTTSGVTTSPATTSTEPAPVTTSPIDVELPAPLVGWETTTITIGDRELFVAVADSAAERVQGFMFVTDPADLDGMLFVWESDVETGFWMKDTYLPLDIVWFDAGGRPVAAATMEPCEADPCPRYSPGAPYRYAVEAPAGDLEFVEDSAMLVVG